MRCGQRQPREASGRDLVGLSSVHPHRRQSLLALAVLGLLSCLLTFSWLAIYAAVGAKVGDVLRREPVRRAVEGVTGVVLVGLGVRIALERRPAG